MFEAPGVRERPKLLPAVLPHLNYLEGQSRGYILLDVTPGQFRGDWYFVRTVDRQTASETRAAAFVCEKNSAHLAPA